ncbi:phosphotransferase family protein [Pseudolysinimonas yzui]|uniref:Aminoglycoside phosphotransferase n=1 Tax=Pseudolysinimonas yzui TaxID=2708254 RepID=A0A8J3GRR5_9MICO|nr:phosphotransferase [Pseudolysinimonas yzui]GHF19589.1 aminoglycoside phosphotransferase [Pseudolysinimonas yzui]
MIGPKLGAGREAEVFAWGRDAVVKLYRPGFRGHEAEAAALRHLEGHGVAPSLIQVVDHDRRRGLVLERLDGSNMLTLLQRQPWRLPNLARHLARAHLRIHAIEAPEDLPDLRDVLATRIHRAPMPSKLREFALRELSTLPRGDRLAHGDFHPGNLLVARDEVTVIDWVGATRGAPEADHARTLLLLRWADPLPGTPPLARGLMATGRSAFARAYAGYYRNGKSRPAMQLSSWLTVVVAARMSEGIEAEHRKLLSLLEAARRREGRGA